MTAKWSRWRYLEARFVTILTIRFKGALVPAWPADRSPTRTGPVEADGAVDAQNAPTAPWKTLLVFHELPQGFPHPITHDKPRKSPESYWETRIDPKSPCPVLVRASEEQSSGATRKCPGRRLGVPCRGGSDAMASTKSSRVNPRYKKKYRVGKLAGVRARAARPRRRHRLVRGRGPQYVDPTSTAASSRAAPLLEPGDPDRAEPAHALPPATSADRGLRRVVAPADGPGPERPEPHDALAAQQGRSGPRPEPSGRRTDSPDRRLDRAEDLRRRRVVFAQAPEGARARRLAEAAPRRGR